jgi:hypothetical protein
MRRGTRVAEGKAGEENRHREKLLNYVKITIFQNVT